MLVFNYISFYESCSYNLYQTSIFLVMGSNKRIIMKVESDLSDKEFLVS